MYSKELLLLTCLGMLGGLRLTSTTTTTTFVAAMSIGNQDLERYFRSVNASQALATMTEDRIAMDMYTYAYLNYTYVENNEVKKVYFNEEKARYGEGRISSVAGKLVHITAADDISDDTACTSNIGGTGGQPTPPTGAWIALVRRGACTFEEKVRNVHAKGAVGVIIFNDKVVTTLEKMQIKGKNRNITAVITYQEIGEQIASIVDQGLDMDIAIIEGRSGMRPINSLNRTSVLFVSISFIVLMVISLVWLIFYYIQRFRYLQTKDQQSRHLCSVTKKAIMKIPTKTGKSCDEKDADNDCCAICIETYKSSDCIRVLPCKHEFHKHCIDPWLIEHRTCPMCKLDVLKFYGYVVGDQVHSTPSPQHLPPVATAPVDNNDVPVVVVPVAVARATPPTAAAAAAPTQCRASGHERTADPASTSISSNHSSNAHNGQTGDSHTSANRRNSAPLVLQVSTASRQFLGSEESILEFEPERNIATGGIAVGNSAIGAAMAVATSSATAAAMAHRGTPATPLADLMRSREFVIDFPRLFVLDAGSAEGSGATLFPERPPERSQSSLSLAHAKDWMAQMSNKLDEQHGLRRLRKSTGAELHETLIDNRSDSVKKRRSRSADGRYSHANLERREVVRLQQQQQRLEGEAAVDDGRDGNFALHSLTEASYAQSHQRLLEGEHVVPLVIGGVVLPLRDQRIAPRARPVTSRAARGSSRPPSNGNASPTGDVAITIQINGEGVDLE